MLRSLFFDRVVWIGVLARERIFLRDFSEKVRFLEIRIDLLIFVKELKQLVQLLGLGGVDLEEEEGKQEEREESSETRSGEVWLRKPHYLNEKLKLAFNNYQE